MIPKPFKDTGKKKVNVNFAAFDTGFVEKVGEAKKKGKMSKGKKGKRGERERSNPYKIIGKEIEVIGESKKKKKNKEKEQQQDDSDIKVVFVKQPQPLGNPSCTSEEGEVTEVDPWNNVHFLEAGVSYGSN